MTIEELVKRLRGVDHMSIEACYWQSPLFGHAADKLEELAAENSLLVSNFKELARLNEAALAEKDKEIAAMWERMEKAEASVSAEMDGMYGYDTGGTDG